MFQHQVRGLRVVACVRNAPDDEGRFQVETTQCRNLIQRE